MPRRNYFAVIQHLDRVEGGMTVDGGGAGRGELYPASPSAAGDDLAERRVEYARSSETSHERDSLSNLLFGMIGEDPKAFAGHDDLAVGLDVDGPSVVDGLPTEVACTLSRGRRQIKPDKPAPPERRVQEARRVVTRHQQVFVLYSRGACNNEVT